MGLCQDAIWRILRPMTWTRPPWEHPDWYDLHDTAWGAGSEREPEHYREAVLALPPLTRADHLVDLGAGTGKLARLVVQSYPEVGHVTLVDPNADKLARAVRRIAELVGEARVTAVHAGLGVGHPIGSMEATVATLGSVLMPIMELRGGTLAHGKTWVRAALAQAVSLLRPDGILMDLETLAAPWASGDDDDSVRRFRLPELVAAIRAAGLPDVECVYRFRDRVALRARRS